MADNQGTMADLFSAVTKVVGSVSVDGKQAARLAQNLVPATPRRRAAVVLRDGYKALDTYHAVRPKVFVGSLAVALGATGMAWWRRRNGAEAVTGWGALAALAGVVAYVTRPTTASGVPQAGPGAQAQVYAWLDQRAATLDRTDPGWEERAMGRMLG